MLAVLFSEAFGSFFQTICDLMVEEAVEVVRFHFALQRFPLLKLQLFLVTFRPILQITFVLNVIQISHPVDRLLDNLAPL